MPTSRGLPFRAISLYAILVAASACSSEDAPPSDGGTQTADVSRDGSSDDGARPDVRETDLPQTDTGPMDAIGADVARDGASGDAPMDVSSSDRTSNDVSSTDVPTDAVSSDAPPSDSPPIDSPTVDSISSDAPTDSAMTDAPADSTPADAPSDGNDPSCPPSWGPGGQCSGNLTCVYPEGACQCLQGCGALPPPDSGRHWYCGMRGAGCPMQKPGAGTPCAMDAQSCNYGTCCSDFMVCENGAWKQGSILCPP
jgi:hypothetical protein